jgi:fatty acid/phospholipid biosynthesis enzyme
VIKSHGGTDSLGFMHAIDVARSEAIARVPQLIDRELEGMLAERRSA